MEINTLINHNKNKGLSLFVALFFGISALLGLQACGGGGGSGSSTPDADVSGIYEGTFTKTGGGVYNLQGIIHNNRAMFILDDGFATGNALIYDGMLSMNGNSFTSNFKEYNQAATTLIGGAFATTGSVASGGVLTINLTSPALGQGSISLTPNTARYEIGADLNNIAVSWDSRPQLFVNGSLRLGFSTSEFISSVPDGVYFGTIGSAPTCGFNIALNSNTRVTITDPTKNTYIVTTVFDCMDGTNDVINGTYSGLIYSTGTTAADNLIFIVTKTDRAVAAFMVD